jgi:hypothetical protein
MNMKMDIDDLRNAKATPSNEMKTRLMRLAMLALLLSAVIGAGGCDGTYYAGYPGYGPSYGPGPYYGGGSVVVAVGDRPYYRGPGYWTGGAYYVWRRGHWAWRHGQQVWIRGHYVVRG